MKFTPLFLIVLCAFVGHAQFDTNRPGHITFTNSAGTNPPGVITFTNPAGTNLPGTIGAGGTFNTNNSHGAITQTNQSGWTNPPSVAPVFPNITALTGAGGVTVSNLGNGTWRIYAPSNSGSGGVSGSQVTTNIYMGGVMIAVSNGVITAYGVSPGNPGGGAGKPYPWWSEWVGGDLHVGGWSRGNPDPGWDNSTMTYLERSRIDTNNFEIITNWPSQTAITFVDTNAATVNYYRLRGWNPSYGFGPAGEITTYTVSLDDSLSVSGSAEPGWSHITWSTSSSRVDSAFISRSDDNGSNYGSETEVTFGDGAYNDNIGGAYGTTLKYKVRFHSNRFGDQTLNQDVGLGVADSFSAWFDYEAGQANVSWRDWSGGSVFYGFGPYADDSSWWGGTGSSASFTAPSYFGSAYIFINGSPSGTVSW